MPRASPGACPAGSEVTLSPMSVAAGILTVILIFVTSLGLIDWEETKHKRRIKQLIKDNITVVPTNGDKCPICDSRTSVINGNLCIVGCRLSRTPHKHKYCTSCNVPFLKTINTSVYILEHRLPEDEKGKLSLLPPGTQYVPFHYSKD